MAGLPKPDVSCGQRNSTELIAGDVEATNSKMPPLFGQVKLSLVHLARPGAPIFSVQARTHSKAHVLRDMRLGHVQKQLTSTLPRCERPPPLTRARRAFEHYGRHTPVCS